MNKISKINLFTLRKCWGPSLVNWRSLTNKLFCTECESNCYEVRSEGDSFHAAFRELLTSSDRKQKIQDIINEYIEARNVGKSVPTTLSAEHMEELLHSETKSQRLKYLSYASKKEKRKLYKLKQSEDKRIENIKLELSDNSKHVRGLSKTTFLRHIQKPSIKRFHNLRLAHASLFGPKLVIDLDYDEFMLRREIRNCIKQLQLVFSVNRRNRNPFDLYVCNMNPTSFSKECLHKAIPSFGQDDCLDTFTEKSYINLFPKEKLVYLSPHARETMMEYDPTAIYIIGAFVDLSTQWKISHEKAELDGIRSLSLPLDDYFKWRCGSKCLSINQVYEILLQLKNTGDWQKAFTVVPQRKYERDGSYKEKMEQCNSSNHSLIACTP